MRVWGLGLCSPQSSVQGSIFPFGLTMYHLPASPPMVGAGGPVVPDLAWVGWLDVHPFFGLTLLLVAHLPPPPPTLGFAMPCGTGVGVAGLW